VAGEVRFATIADAREIAYQVMSEGDGPVIVHDVVGPWPLDLLGEEPMYDRFLRTLGRYGRLVVYDRPGLGSSDPLDAERDWLDQMCEASVAVLDAVGASAGWIVGSSLPQAATMMRVHPARVLGAVLINPLSPKRFQRVVDSSIDRERSPVVDPFSSRAGDPAFAEWLERANRLGSSATDRAVFMRLQRIALDRFFADPQPVEDGPPTMLIRRRGAMSLDELDRWTAIFPGAECVTIEGTDSGVMALDAGLVAELAVGFITGAPVEASTERRLMAVLFTDLVESTPLAATVGDAVWRSTLDRYEAAMHATVQRHHGTVVKRTGDGALATFPSGSEAIAAAVELRSTTRDLGLEGRTGIHVGEIEQRDDDIGGIAVHLAARVMGVARPGEIIVTSTVAESSTGGAFRFADRGVHSLKGLEQPRQLLAVDVDGH
jgi:class 3 adenylate cyclase